MEEIRKLIRSITPPNRTPSRTPPRSRANSIGGSDEDSSAPLSMETRREMMIQIEEALENSGFIMDSSKPSKPSKTSIVPR